MGGGGGGGGRGGGGGGGGKEGLGEGVRERATVHRLKIQYPVAKFKMR